jgi:hypothetical protein
MATQVAEIVKANEHAIEQLNQKLGELIERGKSIDVRDQATCLEAKQFRVEAKSYEKAVDLYADGDIQDAKERLTKLQAAKKMLLAPLVAVLEDVERNRRTWEEDERRKAEAEQHRLQEEARKAAEARAAEERKAREKEIAAQIRAGEIGKREAKALKEQAAVAEQVAAKDVPEVKVQAAIPTLAGTASRRTWKFRIVDASRIPRNFLMPDETSIGRMVRDAKDKGKAEAECPGIEVWSE